MAGRGEHATGRRRRTERLESFVDESIETGHGRTERLDAAMIDGRSDSLG
jgi:hypothetical protein